MGAGYFTQAGSLNHLPRGTNDAHLQSPAARFGGSDSFNLFSSLRYRDSIEEALDMLDGVQLFNLVMIGTSLEPSSAQMPTKLAKEVSPYQPVRNRSEARRVARYGPVMIRGREMQANSVEGGEGFAGLLEGLNSAVQRNNVAAQTAVALRVKALMIRASVPVNGGGVLVRLDFFVKDNDTNNLRFNGIVIVGSGSTYQEVSRRPPEAELLPLPDDYFDGGSWEPKSLFLWVGTPGTGDVCYPEGL